VPGVSRLTVPAGRMDHRRHASSGDGQRQLALLPAWPLRIATTNPAAARRCAARIPTPAIAGTAVRARPRWAVWC